MANDNFTFSETDTEPNAHNNTQSYHMENSGGCPGCPLAQIPAGVWKALFKPPFRKRHPLIFWVAVLTCLFILFMVFNMLLNRKDNLDGEESIALVSIQGPILDAGSTLAWLRKIEESSKIKGILLRINSPGGGAAASQEIYAALARLAAKMPVAVSMGATAASGGLMIAMAGHRIFANPSTITGSIGVRMDIPQIQGLMDKIGIGQETLVTAPFKDAASYMHPLTEKDRAYLESVLKNMHDQFVEIVARGRKMPLEKAASLASGKIFTGQEAMALGLVDVMGGQYEAHAWLSQKTDIPQDRKLKTKPQPRRRLLDAVLGVAGLGSDEIASELEALSERWTQPAFLYQM